MLQKTAMRARWGESKTKALATVIGLAKMADRAQACTCRRYRPSLIRYLIDLELGR